MPGERRWIPLFKIKFRVECKQLQFSCLRRTIMNRKITTHTTQYVEKIDLITFYGYLGMICSKHLPRSQITKLFEDAEDSKTGEIISGARPAHLGFIESGAGPWDIWPKLDGPPIWNFWNTDKSIFIFISTGYLVYGSIAVSIICMLSNCRLPNVLVAITTHINSFETKEKIVKHVFK